MIKRILSKKLLALAKSVPVVAVLGPRQSGKTTLVKGIFRNKPYVSMEDPDTREFAATDPRKFLSSYSNGAIIDEAQRVPVLFSYIQTLVDTSGKPGMFVLTGSQNYLLQEKISQSLAGRVAILRLLPFSLEELRDTPHNYSAYEKYIYKGFYPRVYAQNIKPYDWYKNYIQTYIERDVRMIKNIPDLSSFQKFVKMCAGRIGQILNLSALGNDCGITHNTAKAWLSVLESSYIAFLLKPHHQNFHKRLIKMPKLYFYDSGLACSLLGIETAAQVETHPLKGPLFENMIISEIIKHRENQGLEPNCYFWRSKEGHEIDCLLETNGKLIPVEIKAGATISSDYFKNIKYWNTLSRNESDSSYVIYGGDTDQIRSDGNILGWKNLNKLL